VPERPWLANWRSDGYFAASYAIGLPNLEHHARARRAAGGSAVRRGRAGPDHLSDRQRSALVVYAAGAPVLAWLPMAMSCLAAALALVFVPSGGPVVAFVLALWAATPYLPALARRVRPRTSAVDRFQPRADRQVQR
jgi:hypothetical protein